MTLETGRTPDYNTMQQSPERTPANVAGAEVLGERRLLYESLHLHRPAVGLSGWAAFKRKIAAGELVAHALHDRHCSLV